MSGHGVAVMGRVLCTRHRDQLLDLQVEGASEVQGWLHTCPDCGSRLLDQVGDVDTWSVGGLEPLLSRRELQELCAVHEAAHAVVTHRLGGVVDRVVETHDVLEDPQPGEEMTLGGWVDWRPGQMTRPQIAAMFMAGLVATRRWLAARGYTGLDYEVGVVMTALGDIAATRRTVGSDWVSSTVTALEMRWDDYQDEVQHVARDVIAARRLDRQAFLASIDRAQHQATSTSSPAATSTPAAAQSAAATTTPPPPEGGVAMGIDELRAALAQIASHLSEVAQLSRQGEQVADQASGALASIAGASSQAGVQEAVGIVAELATQLSEAAGRAVHASELLETYASSL